MANNLYLKQNNLSNNPVEENSCLVNSNKMQEILSKEIKNGKNDNWIKLNKTDKIKKLEEFSKSMLNELGTEKCLELKQFLIECLNKKRFEKIRDICYDPEKQVITNIPGLITDPKFILMRTEKRASTIRLPTNVKNKTKRKHNNKKGKNNN